MEIIFESCLFRNSFDGLDREEMLLILPNFYCSVVVGERNW